MPPRSSSSTPARASSARHAARDSTARRISVGVGVQVAEAAREARRLPMARRARVEACTTRAPRRASASAAHSPTMPAPTTATSTDGSALTRGGTRPLRG